jgi:hypothetical protein
MTSHSDDVVPVIRASDVDRGAISAQLRAHCVAGRISIEELERRLDVAMRAETVHDLRKLVADLPQDEPSDRARARAQMSLWRPGVLPFIRQVTVPASLARTRRAAVSTLAPALSAMGFELLDQSDAGLIFERVSRSGWFSTTRERVVISLEKQGADQTLAIIYGRAARAVRKQFATLSF